MTETIGFIGLGVMGEPMCRNLALKSGAKVTAYDLSPAPLARLAEAGVAAAASVADIAAECETIMLSLPGGPEVAAVCGALLPHASAGQVVIDLSTAPLKLTRDLAAGFAERGVAYADAPVARTREAAIAGTLAIMVGASEETFERIEPLLRCMGTDVTRVGDVGAGQVGKLMNNMVLFQNVVALAEALTVARAAGVDGEALLKTVSTGSGDSFALRNHGMKAMLPGVFPERAFSATYAMKDLSYALEMARDAGLTLVGAEGARVMLQRAIDAGDGERYWPALVKSVR